MNEFEKTNQSAYEQQENQLSAQSAAFLQMLTKRGLLADSEIDNDKIRQAQKAKKRQTYHNTEMLLHHYRSIVWALECFPSAVEEELDRPFGTLDALLNYLDVELSLENRKLESRLESIRKSRLLLDRLNEAMSILKKKPGNGEKMYELIYLTYIAPQKLSHTDLVKQLEISTRHYYRLRSQAIGIISLRLWSVPAAEMDAWLEILTLLEELCE